MPETECPSCGGFGNVPKDKLSDRLVCRKCHAVFHVTPAGRAVLGEPPHSHAEDHARGHSHGHGGHGPGGARPGIDFENGITLSPRQIKIGVVTVVVLGLLFYYGPILFGSGKSLEATARDLANDMIKGNQIAIASTSSEESRSDTNLWYSLLRPVLDEMKQTAPDHVLDIALNQSGYGRLAIFFGTEHSPERTTTLAKSAAAAPARTSLNVPTYWERDSYGNWRLDGKRTLAVIPVGMGMGMR